MRAVNSTIALSLVCVMGAAIFACGKGTSISNGAPPTTAVIDAGVTAPPQTLPCVACVTDNDCPSARCVLFGSEDFCAPLCAAGGTCSDDRACVTVPDVAGNNAAVCAPRINECGTSTPITPVSDAGVSLVDAGAEVCGHLVGPDVPGGGCTSKCTQDGGIDRCQVNGCFNGYWCNTDSNACTPAPNGGACGNDGPGVPYDGGPAPTGDIGAEGGLVSRLFFAVVGDTRPATQDDTAAYPTAIISRIFSDLQAATPRPSFGISTGDYVFASPDAGEAAAQLDLYMAARATYTGTMFPGMGNHECTGATKSNCGASNVNGITSNYSAWVSEMLAPIGQTGPSYEIDVAGSDGSWSAKFLFVPGNAWTSAVGTWLDTAMARPTTYTFVVRHEGTDAPTAPGVTPSEAIMANHPYTLAIVGHDHVYARTGTREVTIGNGGAPPTGPSDYGYGLISQRAGSQVLDVDVIDYQTGLADSSFHFAVNPDGSAAQ